MTTHADGPKKHVQAELQFEACREETLPNPCNLDRTTAGMKKELQVMKDFGVYDEAQASDADAR